MNEEQRKQIGELYLEMYAMLMAYAQAALAQDSLAEEAVQETFRIACEKVDVLLSSPNPRGWLVNTLKFSISNIRSKRRAAQRLLEEYQEAAQLNDRAFYEDILPVEILYEDLSHTEEFKLLTELAIEGKSHKEMAESRGISVSACKKRVQRAKELFRKKIKI